MRVFTIIFIFAGFSLNIFAQNRQQTIEKFNDLKIQAQVQEKLILSPDKKDLQEAKQENVNVFRLLPREKYDKGLFSVKGGGAFYSFYFNIPDYGHGSDISLEQNSISTAFTGCGFMSDLGNMFLDDVSKEISQSVSLSNYQNARDEKLCMADHYSFYPQGLKLNETVFNSRLKPIAGHTYLIRSTVYDYYDILAAFQIHRVDEDGSLIIFWKLLDQFETPQRNNSQKAPASDEKVLLETKGWSREELFPNVKVEVTNGVMTLRGQIPKDKLAYVVQLANSAGARKVINFLDIK